MKKLFVLAAVLVIALLVSVVVNVYFASENASLIKENSVQVSKLEMVSVLSRAQVQVNSELQRISDSLVYACWQLSAIGLEGDAARGVLGALVANSSFIVDAGTVNVNGSLVTVEPLGYRSVAGGYVGEAEYLTDSLNSVVPVMFDVMPLVEGFDGLNMMAPVFGSDGSRLGSVSVVFDPTVLLNASIASIIEGTGYAVTVSKLDSKILYDTDPAQQGKVLFDPIYASYISLLELWHHVASESSGYGTYTFVLSAESGQVANKECYWTTIGVCGVEWRLVLIHALTV
jgi:hypothetical protein